MYGLMLPQDQRMKIHLIALRKKESYLRAQLEASRTAAAAEGPPSSSAAPGETSSSSAAGPSAPALMLGRPKISIPDLARHAEGADLLFEAASYFLKACFLLLSSAPAYPLTFSCRPPPADAWASEPAVIDGLSPNPHRPPTKPWLRAPTRTPCG